VDPATRRHSIPPRAVSDRLRIAMPQATPTVTCEYEI